MRGTSRNCLKIAFLCAFVGALPQLALARPKGIGASQCTCMCEAQSGFGGQIEQVDTYPSRGIACSAFEGVTCNVQSRATGGISTGNLIGCGDAASSRPVITYSPFGGIHVQSELKAH
jgi:hypothetical protein